ncbi:FMN-binding negative transcriptional regulator [Pseudonocardia nematodicida]|uniref:FMN-binding negative transcriptional regulator n=1 Tax=Pseudonocardia nematodicida TaxID=1206997 RepID=A0ABV1KD70_9PSEU
MYVPRHFAPDDDAVRALLSRPGAADLVTDGPDGPEATLLPFLHDFYVTPAWYAKFKLSQNRPAADVDGVLAGLRAAGERADADLVEAHRRGPGGPDTT